MAKLMLGRRSLNVALPLRQSVIVFLIVGILFAFSYVLVDRYVVQQKMGDLMNLADAKYVSVLDMLDQGKLLNRERADDESVRTALADYEKGQPAGKDQLMRLVREYKEAGLLRKKHAFGKQPMTRHRFHEILVADKNGKVVASTKNTNVGSSVADTPMWRVGRKKTAVLQPFRDRDGHAVFPYVSPIYAEANRKGPVIGVLINKADTGLLTMLVNADLGNVIGGKLFFAGFQYRDLDIYVMDKRGRYMTQSRVLKHSTILKDKGSALPHRRSLDRHAQGDRTTNVGITTGAREAMDIYQNHQGIVVAGASMPVFEQGWTVAVEQPTTEAFGGLIQLERALVVGGLLAATLAGLVAWTSSRKISRSLAEMGGSSVRLAGGDLKTEFIIRPNEYAEIAALGGSFNIMRMNLEKRIEEINLANERLRENETANKRMVDDLIEFVRPRELALALTTLSELTDEAVAVVVPEKVDVLKDYDPDVGQIEVDRRKILQVLVSVLSFSLNTMPEGGQLTIATGWSASDPSEIEIVVSDTGTGIAPIDIPALFEPTYTTIKTDVGFGLPIADKFISQHGGRITLTSRIGSGSKFVITLPRKQHRQAA